MSRNVVDFKEKVAPTFFPKHQDALYRRLENKDLVVEVGEDDPLGTEMVLNLGPQHPATHGVLRCALQLNGEFIQKCLLDVGYLHRGVEKIAEHKTYQEFMPYTDRMDYLSPYSNNVAFCLAVEKLCGIEAPPRAQLLRTLACELARVSAHLLWLGTMVMDSGAISMFMWTFREREFIYDLFDKFAGVRFTVSHCRIGGLQFDVDDSTLDAIKAFILNFKKEQASWKKLLAKNAIFLRRVDGIGIITPEDAISYGLTGPVIRGCGIAHDIRTFEPYLNYAELDWNVIIRKEGDCLARYYVRVDEMEQSANMILQLIEKLKKPENRGIIRADNAKSTYASKDEIYYSMEGLIHDFMMTDLGVCPPVGAEAYCAVEAPKGELGYHLISDGTGSPLRCKINVPSFTNLQGLEKIMEGAMIADTVVLIGSMDPVMGESDK
jgi:NADH-quinone oxidoreductase subunit D